MLFCKRHFFPLSLSNASFFHELSLKCCLGVFSTYSNHNAEAQFVFSIFVSFSRPHFHCNESYNFICNLLFVHFLEYLLLLFFWMRTCMKKANNFLIATAHAQSVAHLLLEFLPISSACCCL